MTFFYYVRIKIVVKKCGFVKIVLNINKAHRCNRFFIFTLAFSSNTQFALVFSIDFWSQILKLVRQRKMNAAKEKFEDLHPTEHYQHPVYGIKQLERQVCSCSCSCSCSCLCKTFVKMLVSIAYSSRFYCYYYLYYCYYIYFQTTAFFDTGTQEDYKYGNYSKIYINIYKKTLYDLYVFHRVTGLTFSIFSHKKWLGKKF